MGKRVEPEFEFIVDVPPTKDTIKNFHKTLAQIYINKYGLETMKEVVRQIEKNDGVTC